LKRLEDALRDRDHIYALVKGTAVNNDGRRKVGFSAPSIHGQAAVIKAALDAAEVEAESIGCIEAHGTATALGDPVEINALKMAFGNDIQGRCAIGAVKTNIGHTDAAAGIAGFIKMVLALYNRKIAPSLHYSSPNKEIDFDNSPFYVNTQCRTWERTDYPLRGGVSSFGIGGTNAHAVLEEAPGKEESEVSGVQRINHLLLLSAKSAAALERATENMTEYFKANPDASMADTAYTLQVGRGEFKHRRMLVSASPAEAATLLESCQKGSPAAGVKSFKDKGERPGLVFMFPGQGAQYVDMGRELYREQPAFKEEVDRCFDIVRSINGTNLLPVLYPPEGGEDTAAELLQRSHIMQPVIFTIEYALGTLLMKWGHGPDTMIGYSLGEYAAACLAGVFSLEDALKLVTFRGKMLEEQPEGVMLNVPMPEKELETILENMPNLCIAVVNEPSCIVSGPPEDIGQLETILKEKRLVTMRLDVSRAGHSAMMGTEFLQRFEEILETVALEEPTIPFISTVTGEPVSQGQVVAPSYWSTHMRRTVRFSAGIQRLVTNSDQRPYIFLEVGPGRDLSVLVKRFTDAASGTVKEETHGRGGQAQGHRVLNMMQPRRGDVSDNYYLLNRVGMLWLYGKSPDWARFYDDDERYRVSLPTYSFDAHRFWNNADPFKILRNLLQGKGIDSNVFADAGGGIGVGEEPATEPGLHEREGLSSEYCAPQSDMQLKLAELWEDYFGMQQVGINDDFFELGGDSLKAITIGHRIHRDTDVRVPLEEFFKRPTIEVLSRFIEGAQKELHAEIPRVGERDFYPLAPAQKRLFLLQQMDPANTGYNMPAALVLRGMIDMDRLEKVFSQLIARHESLRTSFYMKDNEPVQQVHDEVNFLIECIDMKGTEGYLEKMMEYVRPFDLSRAPLMRIFLMDKGPATMAESAVKGDEAGNEYIFLLDMHHIITDGVSTGIFTREFMALYGGEELTPPVLRYRDYACWKFSGSEKTRMERQEAYWLEQFSEEVPQLMLPTDFMRPAFQGFGGRTVEFSFSRQETALLKEALRREGVTLYMVLAALYGVLLFKLGGNEDIVIGTPTAGRSHPDLEPLIGMFVNTLGLRLRPRGEKSFKEFLLEVKAITLAAFENEDYPFEELVEKVGVKRDTGRNPLFDAMFGFHDMGNEKMEVPGLSMQPADFENRTAKFDLTLQVLKGDESLKLNFEYRTDLFKAETIQRFVGYYRQLVASLDSLLSADLWEADILSQEEKKQLLLDFNASGGGYCRDKTVLQLFEEQVEKTPDAFALVGRSAMNTDETTNANAATGSDGQFHGGKAEPGNLGERVTYRELNEAAIYTAGMLMEKNILPGSIVGILVGRGFEVVAGILAAWKAGAAYLPMSPTNPVERIRYMLADSNATALLTLPGTVEKIDGTIPVIYLDPIVTQQVHHMGRGAHHMGTIPHHMGDDHHAGDNQGEGNEHIPSKPSLPEGMPLARPAYVIYTSGSTGKPKGVLVNFANLSPLLHWQYDILDIGPGDSVLNVPPYYFDWSVIDIFTTLTTGASLHIIPDEMLMNAGFVVSYLNTHNITMLNVTPTQCSYYLDANAGLFSLRYLVLGAEKLTLQFAGRCLEAVGEECRVFNMYGPTEGTLVASLREFRKEDMERFGNLSGVPIGTAVCNNGLLVLDKHLMLCPLHTAGELFMYGEGLAAGYLNNPGLTAEKFIPNPFKKQLESSISPEGILTADLLYGTGDLARRLPDGDIEFLGRIDHQVKIRGLRIELGEIENRLLRHPAVREAVVLDMKADDEVFLCACYTVHTQSDEVPHPGDGAIPYDGAAEPSVEDISETIDLKGFLSETLPDYMVPAYFRRIDQIPLTPNGKADRKKMAAGLEISQLKSSGRYAAPGSETEKKLVEIWTEVLLEGSNSSEAVGIDDDFFQLGGHSLKANAVASVMQTELSVNVSLGNIFRFPTIRAMARYIATANGGESRALAPVEEREYYPLSFAQERLYRAMERNKNTTAYNMPLILDLEGTIDRGKLEKAVNGLIQRHESLRTSFMKISGKPVQRVHKQLEYQPEYYEGGCIEDCIRPFDLSRVPLLRVVLLTLPENGEGKHVLLLDMHNIISDGASPALLMKEFKVLYRRRRLLKQGLRYRDYVLWQRAGALPDGPAPWSGAEKFWLEQFKYLRDEPRQSRRAAGSHPAWGRTGGGGSASLPVERLVFNISKERTQAVAELVKTGGTTSYSVLLAVFNILLASIRGDNNVIVETPVTRRNRKELEKTVGLFAGTIPLRNCLRPGDSFMDFLADVGRNTLLAFENQDYPMELLMKKLDPGCEAENIRTVPKEETISRGGNSFFDVLFIFRDLQPVGTDHVMEIPGLKMTARSYRVVPKEYGMELQATEGTEGIEMELSCRSTEFKAESMQRQAALYVKILDGVLENPGILLQDIIES
ncbi:MAG: amino acid adenylation domain-containing protein, partial [bacterium]|nr:amino acid adenylation domain-containing protein [bacterium]